MIKFAIKVKTAPIFVGLERLAQFNGLFITFCNEPLNKFHYTLFKGLYTIFILGIIRHLRERHLE